MSTDSFICTGCEQVCKGTPSLAMNLGFGVFEWCEVCKPPIEDPDEIIEMFDLAIDPPREVG